MEKAKKLLPDVISAIDTAAKKRILHVKNAAHKKSRVQKAINAGPPKKEEKPVEKIAEGKSVAPEKDIDKKADEIEAAPESPKPPESEEALPEESNAEDNIENTESEK